MKKLFKKLALMVVALLTFSVGSNYTVKEVKAADKTITFELGANGSASHNDGSSKTSYSETVDGYTLDITNGTNMYTGARDAKGNSCIKLGSSKNTGSFKFKVPDDVTSVVIYAAKYKTNTTKVSVNGTAYTLKNNSNDGAYDEITVDTTTTKTISFATVSGGIRGMVDKISFIAIVKDNTDQSNEDKIKEVKTTASLGFDYCIPSESYTKVTENLTDWSGEYIIAYEDESNAYLFNCIDSSNGYESASIKNNTIDISSEMSNCKITISKMKNEDGYSIKTEKGYITGKSGDNALEFSSSEGLNTIEYSEENGILITSNTSVLRFNNASNQMRFRYYKAESYNNQKAINLYKLSSSSDNTSFDNISILFGANVDSSFFVDYKTVSAGVKITVGDKTVDRKVSLLTDENGKYVNYSVGAVLELFADGVCVDDSTKERLKQTIEATVYFVVSDGNTITTLELQPSKVSVALMVDTYVNNNDYNTQKDVLDHMAALKALKAYIEA